jgi:antitoxin component YwqK of YwqJK toxin-antitoxin module
LPLLTTVLYTKHNLKVKGQKQKERSWNKDSKLDGKLIEWFQFNGEIKREENYKNGKILF